MGNLLMKIGTKDTTGNEFFIEVSIEDVIKSVKNLRFFQKIKILFSRPTKDNKEDNSFLSEIWAAKKALVDANTKLEQKIASITASDGYDASEVFSQTDDRQKFEKLFSNGGLKVSIDDVIELCNSLTLKGKKELNNFFNAKK